MVYNLKILLIFLCGLSSFSQHIPQDFIVTKENDTIRGYFTEEGLKEFHPKDKPYLKYRMHYIKDAVAYSRNGKLYEYFRKDVVDGIYNNDNSYLTEEDPNYNYDYKKNFYHKSLKKPDYIITVSKDTVFGKIFEQAIGEKLYLKNRNDEKIKIRYKEVLAYQYNGSFYTTFPDLKNGKKDFYKLERTGEIELYSLEKISYFNSTDAFGNYSGGTYIFNYYLYDGNELKRVKNLYKSICKGLFKKESLICNKIKRKELTIENMPLIMDYYNNL
ncbi:hypothetical protein LX97_01185 [Nonlabens dokdonensis]|jgi:hypothetical protein|uniref:DKNYY family protein n=2 Tax=Nonlabens dokdonensis TaxID=328515 RepID=L7W4I9_NONDD|nr:hypothetical protein [Nonlabens dokdonensis]AGC76525.1 hypothetical protein DDD_1398 [Nonlabens dokdonensis DSW-6]PZX44176.1 hypothetical protein LX97_01185 [Nonlabens dokdonensis]